MPSASLSFSQDASYFSGCFSLHSSSKLEASIHSICTKQDTSQARDNRSLQGGSNSDIIGASMQGCIIDSSHLELEAGVHAGVLQ